MSKLELSFEDAQGVRTIHVDGFVDYDNARTFNDGFTTAVGPSVSLVILDFSKLILINSLGITLVLEAHKRLRDGGGTMVIQSPSAAVLKLLRTLRLDKVLKITASAEESHQFLSQIAPAPSDEKR